MTHGDIEVNPGPKKRRSNYFSCCHWHVKSILTHNKISLLTAYNTFQRFDIICISETYLDSLVDNKTRNPRVYNLFRLDYPNNQKRGVYLYFRENLCLREIGTFS